LAGLEARKDLGSQWWTLTAGQRYGKTTDDSQAGGYDEEDMMKRKRFKQDAEPCIILYSVHRSKYLARSVPFQIQILEFWWICWHYIESMAWQASYRPSGRDKPQRPLWIIISIFGHNNINSKIFQCCATFVGSVRISASVSLEWNCHALGDFPQKVWSSISVDGNDNDQEIGIIGIVWLL